MAEQTFRADDAAATTPTNTQAEDDVTRYEGDRPSGTSVYSSRRQRTQLAFFDGQVPDRETVRNGTVGDETQAALERVRDIAAESGVEPRDLLQTTVYLTDMEAVAAVKRAYAEFFGDERPSRTVVGVDALPNDATVQIEAKGVRR